MALPFSGRKDGLSLSEALPDRSLFILVAMMSFLAALTLTGATGARTLSTRWLAAPRNCLPFRSQNLINLRAGPARPTKPPPRAGPRPCWRTSPPFRLARRSIG